MTAEFHFPSLRLLCTCLLRQSFQDHMLDASVGQITCFHNLHSADVGKMRRNEMDVKASSLGNLSEEIG